jgi:DNA end-binding protein Ku
LKGGEKSYRLLAEVMRRTNKAGLAKFVLAEREYLVAVRSIDGALALTTLHYGDEVLPSEEILPQTDQVDIDVKGSMKKSIKQMLTEFAPGKYANQRRERILDLIGKKMREQTPVEAPQAGEEEGSGPVDLVAALEEIMRKMKEQR